MGKTEGVPLGVQLAAARRESAMRRRVYAGWVRSGRMTREEAEREQAAMDAIGDTLHDLMLERGVPVPTVQSDPEQPPLL